MSAIEYVSMPVPKHLIPAVMAMIAQEMGPTQAHKPNTQGEPAIAPPSEVDQAFVTRVWKESGPTIRKVIKYLAKHPGVVVPASDLATEVYGSAKGHKLSGAMGAFGRRTKNRYGGLKPFSVEWSALNSRWEYTMPASIAKLVGAL